VSTPPRPAAPPPTAGPVVLVGFMGAGKSTVGRLLAARLGVGFADSDAVLTRREGRSPSEIFAADGEAAFRALERAVVAELLARRPGGPGVVALGGGAVQDPGTRALLRRAFVAYLEVSYAHVLARVGGDPGRPVLARPDLEQVYSSRVHAYREVADVTVATDRLAPAAVTEALAAALAGRAGADRGRRPGA
jgi:shikimate kinase